MNGIQSYSSVESVLVRKHLWFYGHENEPIGSAITKMM